MDGYAVCRALRKVDNKVPIVFITGQSELKDYNAGRGGGRRLLPGEADRAGRPQVHDRLVHQPGAQPAGRPGHGDVRDVVPGSLGRTPTTSP